MTTNQNINQMEGKDMIKEMHTEDYSPDSIAIAILKAAIYNLEYGGEIQQISTNDCDEMAKAVEVVKYAMCCTS